MPLLDEIRKQPRHIREIMFGLSVITTLSLVGLVWASSFQNSMYALLNPAEESPASSRHLADEQSSSPLALLGRFWQDMRASIVGLFEGGDAGSGEERTVPERGFETPAARTLPVAEPR